MLLFCDCTWFRRAAREDLSLLCNTSVSAGKWKTSPYFFPTSLAVGVKESAFILSHWKQVSHFLEKHPKSLTTSYFQRCRSRQAEYSSDGFDSLNTYIYSISSHSSMFTVLAHTQWSPCLKTGVLPAASYPRCPPWAQHSLTVSSGAHFQRLLQAWRRTPLHSHLPYHCLLFALQPWLNK